MLRQFLIKIRCHRGFICNMEEVVQMHMAVDKSGHEEAATSVNRLCRLSGGRCDRVYSLPTDADTKESVAHFLTIEQTRVIDDQIGYRATRLGHVFNSFTPSRLVARKKRSCDTVAKKEGL